MEKEGKEEGEDEREGKQGLVLEKRRSRRIERRKRRRRKKRRRKMNGN